MTQHTTPKTDTQIWHERTSESPALRSPIPNVGDLGTFRGVAGMTIPVRVIEVTDGARVTVQATARRGAYARGDEWETSLNWVTLRRHNGITRTPSQPACEYVFRTPSTSTTATTSKTGN